MHGKGQTVFISMPRRLKNFSELTWSQAPEAANLCSLSVMEPVTLEDTKVMAMSLTELWNVKCRP